MNSARLIRYLQENAFLIALSCALALALVNGVIFAIGGPESFARLNNDDVLRLMSVRHLIAGQGWFDMTQYRINPPVGLPVHWSRYIDAGIASIIYPLSLVLPMQTAEQIGVTVWSTLMVILGFLIVGFGTRRVFGTAAACVAVACLMFWPVFADLYMGPGMIDHHNVQILMMLTMAFGLVWPDRPRISGVAIGLAAGFSLAVGLEALLFVLTVGMLVYLSSLTSPSRARLVAFCLSIGMSSVVFWVGQTAPSALLMPRCDQLALPVVALIGVAAAACLLPLVSRRLHSQPLVYLACTAIISVLGLGLTWPLIGPCTAGPYAELPLYLQQMMKNDFIEMAPLWELIARNPVGAIVLVLPVFAALIAGATQHFLDRRNPDISRERTRALGLLLLLCLAGAGLVCLQMRMVNLPAAVVPMIAGYVIARRLIAYHAGRDVVQVVYATLMTVVMITPTAIAINLRPILEQNKAASASEARTTFTSCRSYASLVTLNEAPPGKIIVSPHFGAQIIWATHHDTLSAAFHRSAAAFANSYTPFTLEEDDMESYLLATGATYLLLCAGGTYDSAFATDLAQGGTANWLRRVPLSNPGQVLFEILR
ncbi:hypothetical protein [Yoonia vestfoldensis]|uniref:hypothetical protein n=1 Tax=Yoonia vestfoldensis TaxID=245188 RepID=UPI00037C7DE4|nr:hypothetical protein [Yoonia vestfoldensis]